MHNHATEPGHGLRWDARAGRWWWSGADAPALHAWAPGDGAARTSKLPEGAGLLAHCRSGRLLLGLPKRLCLTEAPAAGVGRAQLRVRALVAVDAAEPRTQICDGRTDRGGKLVFGTGNAGGDQRPIGSFYQYSRQHGLRRLALPAVAQAASICFSGDGRRLYFADAAIGRILHCAYDSGRAAVSAVGVFAQLDGAARPRGAVVDADGCLWSAQPGQLLRYDPAGKVLSRLAIDCGTPAFGGAGMDQLMVAGAAGLVGLAGAAAGLADALYDDHDVAWATQT
ncbi:SMP-30/gluconolactonase/LRE family protein [Massilia glaciei]|uniref:SMP-30/gluconolaconase/LRE-like protein n=1 Tax=Massilia glaciei TaxID=1524097 RepID=A0A2U2HE04_9BURK|nr:SMP-30/gluconolactonase/LRE family protein [Massilia glaciei]PWF41430.1 SMP-30/gluconolaconase/LRE-like protein [Massilia glaciei]